MKKIILNLLLALSLFCGIVSCSEAGHDSRWESLPILIKPVRTKYQQDAIDFYNNLFPGVIVFEISDLPNAVTVNEEKDVIQGKEGGKCEVDYGDGGLIINGSILIDESLSNNAASRNLMAHELMHLLGYSHHDSDADYPSSLMNPNVPIFVSLDSIFGENLLEWIRFTYDLN